MRLWRVTPFSRHFHCCQFQAQAQAQARDQAPMATKLDIKSQLRFPVNNPLSILFAFAVKNPPDLADSDFVLAKNDVALKMSLNSNNNTNGPLKLGKILLKDEPYSMGLMQIHNGKDPLEQKFEKVLGLLAAQSGSKWEDVIAVLREIGMSRLADEISKKLSDSEQLQTGQDFNIT